MILFTADWHLKLGQKNVPVSWSVDRYNSLFFQINELCSNIDLHIIGGDLFDRLPSMEELELYFNFIREVNVRTLIYDGNHEATKKNKTFFSSLKEVTNVINPLVSIVDTTTILAVPGSDKYFTILPYCDLHKSKSLENLDSSIPLFTHVRGEIPPHVKPEVSLDRFAEFPVVFAGDLHAHSNSQLNIVYPGSPVTTSFHRNEVSTGYIIINPEDGFSWTWHEFNVAQLLRKTVSDPAEMVATDYHHTIYEIEGDIQDLASIKNSELLDKKVLKRSNEASLILSKDISIEEELSEYLRYILELKEEKIPEILGTFNDYAGTLKME